MTHSRVPVGTARGSTASRWSVTKSNGRPTPPQAVTALARLADTRQSWVPPVPVHAPDWLVRLTIGALLLAGLLLPLAGGASQLGMPAGSDFRSAPWPRAWDPVLGPAPAITAVLVALTVVGSLAGYALSRGAAIPVPLQGQPQDKPPAGLGPAQLAYIATGRIGEIGLLVPTLLCLQQRGLAAARLNPDGSWRFRGTSLAALWSLADPVGQSVGRALELDQPGGELEIRDWQGYTKLLSAHHAISRSCVSWAYRDQLIRPNSLGRLAHAIWVGAAIVVGLWLLVAALFTPYCGPSIWVLPLAGFLVGCGQDLVRHPNWARLTAAGRQLYAEVTGFRSFLAAPDLAVSRPAPANHQGYLQQLPAAIALGVDEGWLRAHDGADPEANWAPRDPGSWAYQVVDALIECEKALASVDVH